jgi:hypothetical protein
MYCISVTWCILGYDMGGGQAISSRWRGGDMYYLLVIVPIFFHSRAVREDQRSGYGAAGPER